MQFEWSQRSTLVTGATGIVGAMLCETLLERGAHVAALVLDDDPSSNFFRNGTHKKCAIVRGNLSNLESCMRATNLHEVEIVFHLGAQTIVGAAQRDPLECFESNIRGTYHILEASRRLNTLVKAVVVASSDKAYGDSAILPYTEDLPLRGRHPYDVSKSCADLLAQAYAHTYNTNVVIARCGNIYGPGDLNWSRIVPGTIRSLIKGTRPIIRSDGTLVRDYVYVRDAAAAYMVLAEHALRDDIRGEAFNFSGDKELNVLEVVRRIASIMDVPVNPDVQNTASNEIRVQTLDDAKARRLLSWEPQWSLEDGLRETIAWYRDVLGSTEFTQC
jgi:CDP-glucose 4,6-dehydratase